MQHTTTDHQALFAESLETVGFAYREGFSIRLVPWGPDDRPAYEKTINGDRQIIIGTRGEPFLSFDHARLVAIESYRVHFGDGAA